MKNINKVLKCEEFGCYFKIVDGFLQCSPMLKDGTNENEWADVEDFYPDATNTVNDYYGTKYKCNTLEDSIWDNEEKI